MTISRPHLRLVLLMLVAALLLIVRASVGFGSEAASVTLVHPTSEEPLLPKLAEVRLIVGEREVAPVGHFDGAFTETPCGGWRLREGRDTIAGWRPAGPTSAWEMPHSSSRALLGVDGELAYFADSDAKDSQVLRLRVRDGAWLDPWTFGSAELGLEDDPVVSGWVSALLADGDSLFVLRRELDAQVEWPEDVPSSYAVARLDPATGKPTWSRRFPCERPPEGARAGLRAPRHTGLLHRGVRELQVVDGRLLVCPGGVDSVRVLALDSGEQRWAMERLWEYRRSYIGPSVWEHYVGRFGMSESFPPDNLEAVVAEQRTALEKIQIGSIVAGPWPVDVHDSLLRRGKEGHRLLIAVGVAPVDEWHEYLNQCIVYEISPDGTPISLVAIPRMISRQAPVLFDDCVVVACEGSAFACVAASEASDSELSGGFPGSGDERVGSVRWFREERAVHTEPWLQCGPAGDPVAVSSTLCVRTDGGGRIEDAGAGEFVFPLLLLDPADGTVRKTQLRVPFEGEFALPSTNYTGRGRTTITWGANGLALTWLEFADDRLRVTLANEDDQVWTLEFSQDDLIR